MAKKKEIKKTHLTDLEMLRIDSESRIDKSRKSELKVLQLEKQVQLLTKKILELQIQLLDKDVSSKETAQLKMQEQHVKERKEYLLFFDALKESLGVKSTKNFGYDPETGEVDLT